MDIFGPEYKIKKQRLLYKWQDQKKHTEYEASVDFDLLSDINILPTEDVSHLDLTGTTRKQYFPTNTIYLSLTLDWENSTSNLEC